MLVDMGVTASVVLSDGEMTSAAVKCTRRNARTMDISIKVKTKYHVQLGRSECMMVGMQSSFQQL